ncbi:metalloregulator ArsR/SmtB family transcription factor [Candidatus Protofrankia californiensis]|uniref:metalloregulator ArsR/SmtB family transcription factor n=1 Tax=Candidatus Protofrankia californiensis TaxID=1839754 RepID=UPI0010416DC4|nr:metalloregulator ArsR/SmtB family transcription factor [Candidatus Protofrankia californiensis]
MGDDRLHEFFAVLASRRRRDLLERLRESDATVGELAEWYKADVQAVSEDLMMLEQAGLVSRREEAHRSLMHLNAEVFDLMTGWIEQVRPRVERRDQETPRRPLGDP